MKEHVLNLMKQQMSSAIEDLTYDNIRETYDKIGRAIDILDSMTYLPELSVDTPQVIETSQSNVEVEVTESEEEKDVRGPYRFDRKIKGGFIEEIGAFVPEKMIREMNLRNGDLVYATHIADQAYGPPKYHYEIAERMNADKNEQRVQVEYCIVEYDPSINRHIVEKTINGEKIYFDDHEISQTILLPDEDVRDMKLSQGDIIDVAFYKNNPNYLRVIWKYPTDEETNHTTPKPSSYYKDKSTGEEEEIEPIFEGKTICMMGWEPGKADFKEEIEKRGGDLIWVSGKESETQLEAAFDKSDAVVLMLGHVGHRGTIFAVNACKKKGIPVSNSKTFGRSNFISIAKELVTSE